MKRALAAAVILSASCGNAAPPPAVSPPPARSVAPPPVQPAPPPRPPTAAPVCHPIVSGCGCAYQCARGMHETSPARWQVIHDLQDSRLDDGEIQRWCFDAAGHGSPAAGAAADASRCLDVFFDGTPCGGECIPTTAYLGCHAAGDRCVP